MKAFRSYLLTAAVLFVAVVLPCRSVAAPGQTSHFKLKGLSADAFFDSLDPTGCVETSTSISAINGRIKTVGGPEATSMAFVSTFQFDNCSGTFLFGAFGFASLPVGAFQIDKKFTSATLNTSIEMSDFSGMTFPADISMSWSAIGPPTMSKSHSIFKAPGFLSISTFNETSRAAAASGSVTALGTDWSPNPAVFADLNSIKEGDLSVTHPSH